MKSINKILLAEAIAIILISSVVVYACIKDDSHTSSVSDKVQTREMGARTGEAIDSLVQGAGSPCDSVYYVPVAFGAPIKMIPQTIASGNRKGIPWWQGKGYVFSKITPTNYQQDPLKERMVFGDTISIGANDTFYICRKIVK